MGLYDPHQPTKHFFLFILHVHKTAIHGNFHANQTQILTRETFVLFSVLFNYLSDYVQINILHLLWNRSKRIFGIIHVPAKSCWISVKADVSFLSRCSKVFLVSAFSCKSIRISSSTSNTWKRKISLDSSGYWHGNKANANWFASHPSQFLVNPGSTLNYYFCRCRRDTNSSFEKNRSCEL